jgi:hypothetical protein
MDNYDIYLFNLRYQNDAGSKKRPVAIINYDVLLSDIVGLYSYRKWFDNNPNFLEIVDIDFAGLDRRSFVKLSDITTIETNTIDTNSFIGKLSVKDSNTLATAIEEYYS